MHTIDFPRCRGDALRALEEWIPCASSYVKKRNFVVPGHPFVSRLSPAVRCRLVLEEEVATLARERFAFSTVEKFVQEVYWRLYWKGWLEMRPGVWRGYRKAVCELSGEKIKRATQVMDGRGGLEIMDFFARELIETGYLHNHARMWFAGYWIHVERLPWELGADFFYRHLLDGDPASNTLSWRWVAGLQTPGKTYLPRRGNLEKYLDPSVLEDHRGGLDQLERVEAFRVSDHVAEIDLKARWPSAGVVEGGLLSGRVGLWIHEDDLTIESSPLAEQVVHAALATAPKTLWDKHGYSDRRQAYLVEALGDGARRAADHFGIDVMVDDRTDCELGDCVFEWAVRERLDSVIALWPFVGPIGDEVAGLGGMLNRHGIGLELRRRESDERILPKAKRGFFAFWKSLSGELGGSGDSDHVRGWRGRS
ncbi:MAG: FAD-binding domain-containing protein [Verrucomicrobiota bacterium]